MAHSNGTGAVAIVRQVRVAGSNAAPSARGGVVGSMHDALGGHGGASLPPTISTSSPVQCTVVDPRRLSGLAGSCVQPAGGPASSALPQPAAPRTTAAAQVASPIRIIER